MVAKVDSTTVLIVIIQRQPEALLHSSIVWMDIEFGTAGLISGWNHLATNSGTNVVSNYMCASVDRDTLNGFYDWISQNTGFMVRAYSIDNIWSYTFGGYGDIPTTWESTSEYQTSILPGSSGWCEVSACSMFFGGQNTGSAKALVWQWSSGTNDYDQGDTSRF